MRIRRGAALGFVLSLAVASVADAVSGAVLSRSHRRFEGWKGGASACILGSWMLGIGLVFVSADGCRADKRCGRSIGLVFASGEIQRR